MCHVKCLFCMYFMNYTRRPLLHSRMDAYPIAVQGCNWVTRVYVNYLNKARVFAEVERTEPIHTQFDVVTRQTFFFLLIHSSLHRFMCWSLKVYLNLLSTTIWGQRFCVHKRIRENIFFFFLPHWCGDVGVNLPSGLLCHGRLFDFDFSSILVVDTNTSFIQRRCSQWRDPPDECIASVTRRGQKVFCRLIESCLHSVYICFFRKVSTL